MKLALPQITNYMDNYLNLQKELEILFCSSFHCDTYEIISSDLTLEL